MTLLRLLVGLNNGTAKNMHGSAAANAKSGAAGSNQQRVACA
jgi:hypothetical protein